LLKEAVTLALTYVSYKLISRREGHDACAVRLC